MIDKSKAIDAEFTVKKEKKTNFFHQKREPVDAVFREKSKRKRFFSASKKVGKGVLAVGRATGKGLLAAGRGSVKAGNVLASGADRTYRGIGRANQAHRVRVLQKQQYKSQLLEQRLQQQNIKSLLPEKKRRALPLSDRGLPKVYVGKKPKKRGGFFA